MSLERYFHKKKKKRKKKEKEKKKKKKKALIHVRETEQPTSGLMMVF